eukprot:TRINITY_DN37190_c0_g1_i1.p1 TRINITY_DN37190_c0_g1~~TRINITY_DN37190_c0_g1_i1.p1  ORF type:complete len:489 (+),score=114.43 TRINITY_DN37190_c0_g1_i1:112-1578(+)
MVVAAPYPASDGSGRFRAPPRSCCAAPGGGGPAARRLGAGGGCVGGAGANAPGIKGTARLPRLQPNVNKRAQEIIAAHMGTRSTANTASSLCSVPVLSQLDSTAPRTAVTHDISHLCDESAPLRPKIPETLIPEEDHVFEATFMPKDHLSFYSDHDGLWHTKVFPSSTPSSRQDAVQLDAWITRALAKGTMSTDEVIPVGAIGGDEGSTALEELVPILSVALHEMVRQVTHQCVERGTVLEKIWRTYVELFDRVLRQLRQSVIAERLRAAEVADALSAVRRELGARRKEHPQQLHRVITELESTFAQRQKSFEEELITAETENYKLKEDLRTHQKELELWYPYYPLYKESYVKGNVPQVSGHRHTRSQENMAPEVAVAEDFKRLLAVLAPDKRKLIGYLIGRFDALESPEPGFRERRASTERRRSSTEGSSVGESSSRRRESEMMAKREQDFDLLQAEVQQQEEHIQKLQAEIARLESGRLASSAVLG